MGPIILWLRNDLRLGDHPALGAALGIKRPILPLYVWSPEEDGPWSPGGATKWWLHQSLAAFQGQLNKLGGELILRKGPTLATITDLARKTQAEAVIWNRHFEPRAIALEEKIEREIKKLGCQARAFPGNLLREPWEIKTQSGNPYRVFTPFYRTLLKMPEPPSTTPAPKKIPFYGKKLPSLKLNQLQLQPQIDWAGGIRKRWSPGEAGAKKQLQLFIKKALKAYAKDRDFPYLPGTSRLSPHLHFGEITPKQIWQATKKVPPAKPFLRQLIWREFAYHLLFYFPATPNRALQERFARFPWKKDRMALRAWQRGETGYPIVDAGMRQLWTCGWMHNRVRLITGSFLVKDLLQPWQEGAQWFWDTLVDADLANNTLGWQWIAGCGADAAPFFRIFNPVTQGKRFDPYGDYIRKWIPEIAKLPDRYIHQPWAAPNAELKKANLTLGKAYPKPIVDHGEARNRALQAFKAMKG